MKELRSNEKINFIRTGPRGKKPVVLLHAVGTDLTLWGPQIAILQKSYDTIALDLPGHGLSEKPVGIPSFETFAESVADVLETLETGPVHLVGISFGSMVAQTLAISRPDLVSSLTLIGSAGTFSENVRGALSERANFIRAYGMKAVAPYSLDRWFTKRFAGRRPDVVDGVRKLLYQQDAAFHAALWDIISSLHTLPELEKISVPALVIVGAEDTSTPASSAEVLAETLKTDRLHIVPGATHFTNLEAPEAVNQLMLNFLESLD